MTEQTHSEQSDIAQARRLARDVVSRDDCTLIEALLADALGHLIDEVERTRNHLDALEGPRASGRPTGSSMTLPGRSDYPAPVIDDPDAR